VDTIGQRKQPPADRAEVFVAKHAEYQVNLPSAVLAQEISQHLSPLCVMSAIQQGSSGAAVLIEPARPAGFDKPSSYGRDWDSEGPKSFDAHHGQGGISRLMLPCQSKSEAMVTAARRLQIHRNAPPIDICETDLARAIDFHQRRSRSQGLIAYHISGFARLRP
jgi:hypothetical protein